MHDSVSPKPKKIRKNQPHARLIDVGFRTYVRYEVGKTWCACESDNQKAVQEILKVYKLKK